MLDHGILYLIMTLILSTKKRVQRANSICGYGCLFTTSLKLGEADALKR